MREVILYNFQKHATFTLKKKRLAAGTMIKYDITLFTIQPKKHVISYLVIFF